MFSGLGAARFDVTCTGLDGRALGFHPGRDWRVLGPAMESMLELADARRHNVIVRPRGARAELIQLDDLDGAGLARVDGLAFLVLATSAGNHQAWVAVEGGRPDLARPAHMPASPPLRLRSRQRGPKQPGPKRPSPKCVHPGPPPQADHFDDEAGRVLLKAMEPFPHARQVLIDTVNRILDGQS